MTDKGQIGFGRPSLAPEDFTTDRLIIVYYPAGAGGKFLINALGLSNQSVLQDINLAKQQHEGQLSSDDKLNLLVNRYREKMPDAGLGCVELFGVGDVQYPMLKEYYPFNSFIKTIIDNKYYFFLVAHNSIELKNMLDVWPKARLIYFINGISLMEKYRQGRLLRYYKLTALREWWEFNRQPSWPEHPPAWQESLNTPPFSTRLKFDNPETLEKLLTLLPNESIINKIDETEAQIVEQLAKSVEHSYCWDATWYEDKSVCFEQLESLYRQLELVDYDADRIDQLYSIWKQQL